jgi:hypothetical protein
MRIDWQLNGASSQMLDIRVIDLNGRQVGDVQKVRRAGEIEMPAVAGNYVVEVNVTRRESHRLMVVRW